MVVLWLVSSNFRSSVNSVAGTGNSLARNVVRNVVNLHQQRNPITGFGSSQLPTCMSQEHLVFEEEEELESLLVVRDRGKGQADVTTNLEQEEEDGDLV